MNSAAKLESWTQTVHPEGTLLLTRRFRDMAPIRKFVIYTGATLLVAIVGQFIWNCYALLQMHTKIPSLSLWIPGLVVTSVFLLTVLWFLGGLRMSSLFRSTLWGDEALLIRENYLEYRVIFGSWRRVTRITDGWVYLEQFEGACQTGYQVRVRGKGGDIVLDKNAYYAQSLLADTSEVPTNIAQLAELIAQKTGWSLDVPSLLRRGSQIRTV
jgi:hypothetical protein